MYEVAILLQAGASGSPASPIAWIAEIIIFVGLQAVPSQNHDFEMDIVKKNNEKYLGVDFYMLPSLLLQRTRQRKQNVKKI